MQGRGAHLELPARASFLAVAMAPRRAARISFLELT